MDSIPNISKSTLAKLQARAARAGRTVDEYLQWMLSRDETEEKHPETTPADTASFEERRQKVLEAIAEIKADFEQAGLDEQEEVARMIQERPNTNKAYYGRSFSSSDTGDA